MIASPLRALLAAALAALSSAPTAFAQDAAVANAEFTTVRFENDRIRVLETTLPPGAREPEHGHPAHLIYVLRGGGIRNHAGDGTVTEGAAPDGAVLFREATTRSTENVGESPIRALLVELKSAGALEVGGAMPVAQTAVRDLIDAFWKAIEDGDRDGLSRVMADDEEMVNFGTDARERWVGIGTYLDVHDEIFRTVEFVRIERRDAQVRVHRSGDVAWFSEVADLELVAGGQPMSLRGLRATGVAERRDAGWVIVQMHASAPEAGQAIEYGEPVAEEKAEVLRAVHRFFDAMEARDEEAARAVVDPEGDFVSVRWTDEGERVVRRSSVEAFLEGLGAGKEVYLERMWDAEVRIHGPIADVWAPYDFHLDGAFLHCGVDAFQLLRTDAGWVITGGIYTAERTGCAESPLGPPGG